MNDALKKEARVMMEYALSDSDKEFVMNQLDMAIDRATLAERKRCVDIARGWYGTTNEAVNVVVRMIEKEADE